MALNRKSKQAIGVMLGLIAGAFVGISIISPKHTATELRIKETEYYEDQRVENADKDRAAMQGACKNGAIKAVPTGQIVTCKFGMWIYPQFAEKQM